MTVSLRWGRLAIYFVALVVVCLYCEVIGRVWSLWLAPKGSKARVRRANLVTRHWHVVLTELTLRVLGCRLEVRGTVPPAATSWSPITRAPRTSPYSRGRCAA